MYFISSFPHLLYYEAYAAFISVLVRSLDIMILSCIPPDILVDL